MRGMRGIESIVCMPMPPMASQHRIPWVAARHPVVWASGAVSVPVVVVVVLVGQTILHAMYAKATLRTPPWTTALRVWVGMCPRGVPRATCLLLWAGQTMTKGAWVPMLSAQAGLGGGHQPLRDRTPPHALLALLRIAWCPPMPLTMSLVMAVVAVAPPRVPPFVNVAPHRPPQPLRIFNSHPTPPMTSTTSPPMP